MDGSTKLKSWYHKTYKDDPIWEDMDDDADFIGLYHTLNEHRDVYEYFGVGDSLVRERLFQQLAKMMGVEYDVVYNQWLGKPNKSSVNGLSVGDIWYSMWGYEQTNIDWYEVTKVTEKMVWLTPIGGNRTETAFMQGDTTPQPGCYRGKAIRRKICGTGENIHANVTSYASARPWDGKPKHYTSYA